MLGNWAIPVLASILILSAIAIPNAGLAYGQLCPVTGCLTDNLYVVDISHQTVRQYDSTGTLLDDEFITGVFPFSVAFDSAGNIYVGEQAFFFAVVQYDSTGTLLNADFAPGLTFPKALAFDSAGNLYVVDISTVRQYDSAGTLLNADFAPGVLAPTSIAFDSSGNLYVADVTPNTVMQYDSAGMLLDAEFATGIGAPLSVAFDSDGNLYVADLLGTVRQYDSTGTLINADFAPGLTTPVALAFDSVGNLYVVDTPPGTVRQYDSTGNLINADFALELSSPQGIAFDVAIPPITCGADTELIDNVCVVTQALRDEITGLEAALAAALANIVTLQGTLGNALADLAAALLTITGLEEALLGPGINEYSPDQCTKFKEIADAQIAKGKDLNVSLRSQLVACGLL